MRRHRGGAGAGACPMGRARRLHAVDDRVVKDRNVVTSQGVGTDIEFALELVEQLYGQLTAEEVAGPLVGTTI